MARKFGKMAAAQDEQADLPKTSPGMCSAYGCPMQGSISHSVTGGDMFMCHMHFRAHISRWHELTTRVRQHMTHVNLIKEIRQAQNGRPFDYRMWLSMISENHKDLVPNDNDRRKNGSLSMRLWLDRLEKMLFTRVMPGMEEEEKHNGQARNSEEIMKHIEEFLLAHRVQASK